MRIGVSAAIDRRLEDLIVAWLRRQWPILRLVPSRWIQLAVTPSAVRLRRSVARVSFAIAVSGAVALLLLAVAP
jgi:hypothetical protein